MTVCLEGRALGCALLVASLVAVVACQPVDEIDDLSVPPTAEGDAQGADRRGAPPAAPENFAEVLAHGATEAQAWQRDARLAEAVVEVDPSGRLVDSVLTYLAPDADRFLTVHAGPDGIRQERSLLATLDLPALPASAVGSVPPLPEDSRSPDELIDAAGEAFAGCDVEATPATLLYSTGAPLAWDPEARAWTTPLEWTATVTSAEGVGVVFDPVTAEPLDCVPAAV